MSVEAKEKGTFPLRLVVLEAALVAFGVVLALAATEAWEASERRQQADDALLTVVAELEENRGLVVASRDYHAGLMEGMRTTLSTGSGLNPGMFGDGFVNPADLVTVAWDAANSTGATADMDYATVLTVSRAYGHFDAYRLQGRTVSDLLYRQLFEGGTQEVVDNPQGLFSMISTFLYRECELLRTIGQTLGAMDTTGAPAVEEDPGCAQMLDRGRG